MDLNPLLLEYLIIKKYECTNQIYQLPFYHNTSLLKKLNSIANSPKRLELFYGQIKIMHKTLMGIQHKPKPSPEKERLSETGGNLRTTILSLANPPKREEL